MTPCEKNALRRLGNGQVARRFLQIPFAHAAALVLRLFFPMSDAMASTLAALSLYALGIELIGRQ
jgi:hypothetical protein